MIKNPKLTEIMSYLQMEANLTFVVRIIVWRRKNEERNPKNLIGAVKHGDGGVLV